ncbi:MAG: 3-hydroxyacyl-CoA dehydrogenase family protein [Candidatus Riflebacteria bacterium]|nr:3-hydroxyacyl-CoA dehydrogenase family protein [Candidatus Riflebacteria bacterium]
MELNTRLKNVAVVGAAGKMGRGICLLMTDLIANLQLNSPNKLGYKITMVDVSDDALSGLLEYLRSQLRKYAEKNINNLRKAYASRKDLVENGEMIDEFINGAMLLPRPTTLLEAAKDATIVFEAAIENIDIKNQIYATLDKVCSKDTFYYTNTSSMPIAELEKVGGLKGRIMGVHFYNPPPVQKLVEMIISKNTRPEVKEAAYEIGKMLKKTLIPSNDVAGFIGNGHFMRDGLHAIGEVEALQKIGMKMYEGIYALNRVSQDFMIRPMGIFQLIDYVGLDVYQLILQVMKKHLNDKELHSQLIDEMIKQDVKGGQFADGSQKDGFLKYEKNRPVGVYCTKEKKYILFTENNWTKAIDEKLGEVPTGYQPWKALLSDKGKDKKLEAYFTSMKSMNTTGATLAWKYLLRSKEIAHFLKNSGVTDDVENVNGVLMNGFYHLYGPVNKYY